MIAWPSWKCSEASVPEVGDSIPQVTFVEAEEILGKSGHKVYGKDLDPEAERRLCQWSVEQHNLRVSFRGRLPARQPAHVHQLPGR